MALNPLAAPKGVRLSCELCQKPAHVQCTQCRATYYCSHTHQDEDWVAIHEKICPLVALLSSPQPHASSQEERRHREHQQELRKRHIVRLALQEGHRLLHSGQPDLATPAAMQAVKYLTELGRGGGVADIAPAYLVLSEAAIQLGRLMEAEQYLSQVQWSTLQTTDMPPHLLSSLHRNLGQLSVAKGNLTEARSHFAEDVYQASVAYGTGSTQTAGGYFHLSRVFLSEGQEDIATSLQSQVVRSWCDYLSQLTVSPKPSLDTAMRAEAMCVLHSISEVQERVLRHPSPHHPSPHHPSLDHLIHTYHALALFHSVTGEREKAIAYAQQALDMCSHGNQLHATLQSLVDRLSADVEQQ